MRKFFDLVRLKYGPVSVTSASSEGVKRLSNREIANKLGLCHTTVNRYIRAIESAGLNQWPLPEGMTAEDLEMILSPEVTSHRKRVIPDWEELHKKLETEKGATLQVEWELYKEKHGSDAYSLTQYKEHFRRWRNRHNVVMRFEHRAGDNVYVDFAGKRMNVTNRDTGKINRVHVFVGSLGYSQYTYAETVESQKLDNWIMCHVHMFSYFGGVPRTIVCDNLKSGVLGPDRYEADIHPTYWELSNHYGTVIQPARVRKPRDKSIAENAVKIITQRILYPLSSHTFYTLSDLNAAISELLPDVNGRPFQQKDGSRQEKFDGIERVTLLPLPKYPYEHAKWKRVKVGPTYHICPDRKEGRFYSVPYDLCGQYLDVRISDRFIIAYNTVNNVSRVVATHERKRYSGFSTHESHRSFEHLAVSKWTPDKLLSRAGHVGVNTGKLVHAIFVKRYKYAEQGVSSVLGLLSLEKTYGKSALERACELALRHELYSFKSVRSILSNKMYERSGERNNDNLITSLMKNHRNARGARYFAPKARNDIKVRTDITTAANKNNNNNEDNI